LYLVRAADAKGQGVAVVAASRSGGTGAAWSDSLMSELTPSGCRAGQRLGARVRAARPGWACHGARRQQDWHRHHLRRCRKYAPGGRRPARDPSRSRPADHHAAATRPIAGDGEDRPW
jgi:hypothetical protein